MKNSIQLSLRLWMLLAGFLLANLLAFSQAPDYTYDLGAKINELKLTQGGTLVAATNDGLVGVKAGSNEPLFNFTEYGRVKLEELYYVPNSPYVVVGQTGFGGMTTKSAVIDYISGKTLFATEQNGWKYIMTSDVMMPHNKLIVSGQRKAADQYAGAVAVYNLDTGEQESYFDFKQIKKQKGVKVNTITGKPLLLKDGAILASDKGVFKINFNTNSVEWGSDVKNVQWMAANESETEFYAFQAKGNNTEIHKLDKHGNALWKDTPKVKGSVVNFEITPKGLAIVSDVDNSGKSGLMKMASGKSESKIAFLNSQNGEDLWDKAPKTKGYVQHFYIMDDGILFGIQEGGINKISYEGNTLFKKPLKTGENILTMAETP